MPAAAKMSSTRTPSQAVSSFVHFVTQCMSRVAMDWGSALNSAQFHLAMGFGPSFSVNDQSDVDTCGVGPADRTGKSCSRYWPGGIRPAISDGVRRPVKPRVVVIL